MVDQEQLLNTAAAQLNSALLGNCSKKLFNVRLSCSSYQKYFWLCLGILTVESIIVFGAVLQLFEQVY